MLLIELATQAVKGFSPQSRALLKPGYNVLAPPAGTPAGLGDLLSALLFNDGRGGDAMLGTGQAPARAGLTVQGRDGRTYRLVRNLGGAGALNRLEPNNAWSVVSQDALEIGNALRAALGLPAKGQFEEVFCLSARQLPSRRAAEKSAAGAVAQAVHGGSAAPAAAGKSLRPNALVEAAMAASKQQFDPTHAQQQIVQLRAEIEAGKRIEEEQFKLEGLQQRMFALAQKVKQIDKLVADVDAARQTLGKAQTFETLGLPPDAFERAARYDEALKKRDQDLTKLRFEESDAKERALDARPEPIWRNRNFLIGVGLGLLTMVIGAAFRGEPLGYVALLDIPAFGYAGLCMLQWIGDLQRADSLARKVDVNKDREQKVNGAFDNEYFPVSFALKTLELETGKEFIEYFKKTEQTRAALVAAESKLSAARADPSFGTALEEHDALAVQVKALEGQIGELGAGLTRTWREAEAEMQDLEYQLNGGSARASALGGSFDDGARKAAGEDPLPRLLASAVDLFPGATVETLVPALRDRIAQYLVALSDRRFVGLELGPKGEATLSAPGRAVPAAQLEPGDLDLLYVCARLTLFERLAPITQVPALVDDPFLGWADAKLQLISRMLKHIATLTQVVHVSAHPAHRALADHAQQL